MDFSSEKFLRAILDPEGNSEVEILNSELDTGIIGKETSYVSSIIGLTVEYVKGGEILRGKFIIKDTSAAPLYEVGKLCGLYDREIKMYSKVLPEMSKLLQPEIFYPLFFKSVYDEVLILEDLKAAGYSPIDRKKQLDLPHCMEALKMLAKFHAASVKLNKTMNLEDVKSDLWFEYKGKENLLLSIFESGYEIVAKILEEEIPECVGRFKELKDDVLKASKLMVNENKNGFNVLNHGDFHIINLMFKHDQNGNLVDGKTFDFQISRWCSPVVDIAYFLINGSQFEIFKMHSNLLFSFYIEVLNDTLQKYGCKESYKFENLKKDFEESWKLGLFILVTISCLVFVESAESLDFDKISTEECVQFDTFKKSYESKKYKQVLFDWISYYHQKGYF